MKNSSMERRESEYKIYDSFKDVNGQAHFPNMSLAAKQITPMNPWTLNGKKIPTKPIK